MSDVEKINYNIPEVFSRFIYFLPTKVKFLYKSKLEQALLNPLLKSDNGMKEEVTKLIYLMLDTTYEYPISEEDDYIIKKKIIKEINTIGYDIDTTKYIAKYISFKNEEDDDGESKFVPLSVASNFDNENQIENESENGIDFDVDMTQEF